MSKYYHRGNGVVVIPERSRPSLNYEKDFINHLPIYAYCNPKNPVGWIEGEEVYLVARPKSHYDDFKGVKRIWIEPKNKVTVISAREMSAKEIEELKREIERLKMDNMAHEYNQAEAQRFAPEYERQIREDEADKWREQVSKLREGLGHILKEYEHSCKLMAEANGMFWSENNVSISAKQLLNETK